MIKKSKYNYILGIQCFATIDSGACIIRVNNEKNDYDYVAISEERLIRKKYPYTFPLHSIKYCMKHFNIQKLNHIDLLVSDIIREPVWHRSGPSYNVQEFDYIKSLLNFPEKKIIQINHHLAHAASVYYTSGFQDSAILIVDGNGTDLETNSFFEGKNKKIKLIDKYKARGIGALYSIITQDCLNLGVGGEGKTMGLAPFGNKGSSVLDFSKVRLDGIVTDYSSILKRMPHSDIISLNKNKKISKLAIDLDKRDLKEDITKKKWSRIAYDLQSETERCMIHLGKEIQKRIKSKNICIAGGVALNSVANQKLFDRTNFKDIFVYPACSDAGVPFGLAVWALYNQPNLIKKPIKLKKLKNAYTGIIYGKGCINSFLKKNKIKSKDINLTELAKYLAKGKIVAWFQNGSEYGPRALGNRSILADSRNSKIKDYVNNKVKHRESYRPFAPAVLEEDYKLYFKLKNPSPYMLLVAKVRNSKRISAITHVDGTARVQTVNRNQNTIFYDLIKEFKKITKVGCILNTSFNDAGEPIVETPEDAMITFMGTKIDYLVLGDQIIDRKNIKKSFRKKLINNRSNTIKKNEKKTIKLLTSNYTLKGRKKFIERGEKIAYWNCLDKSLLDLKKKIDIWKKSKKKMILYGTYDQTEFLLNNIENFKKLNIVGFLPYKYINDEYTSKNKIVFPFKQLKKSSRILKEKNIEILITSYEYAYDIERDINSCFPSVKYLKFYTGYSRDLKFYSTLKNIIK